MAQKYEQYKDTSKMTREGKKDYVYSICLALFSKRRPPDKLLETFLKPETVENIRRYCIPKPWSTAPRLHSALKNILGVDVGGYWSTEGYKQRLRCYKPTTFEDNIRVLFAEEFADLFVECLTAILAESELKQI